jgi:acid phosphatase (class A)
MKKQIILLMYVVTACAANAQQNFNLALKPVSDHYKDLQQYSAAINLQRAWMDTIKYPPAEFGNSITFLLVKPYYLSPDQVSALSKSVNPPANSSDQVRKELDYLLDLQAKRSAEQIKRVEFLGDIGYWPQINLLPTHASYNQNLKDLFFEGRELLGENVNAKNFPAISKLLQGIMQDMRIMEFTIKYKLLRPRPYHLEPALSPLTRINSPSFASGHTLWAFVQAFTWTQIIPEEQNEFIKLAEEIRRSREIMGIHFPSDNEASRQVAYKMMQFYWKNSVFQKDLKNAIHEWSSKRNTILVK